MSYGNENERATELAMILAAGPLGKHRPASA